MCGIAATFDRDHCEQLIEIMAYRGDRSAVMEISQGSKGVFIGHVRLPILGLSEEWDQPVKLDDGSVVAFAGEILNFRQYSGHEEAQCDRDLAVALWKEGGLKSFQRADGFWAIVAGYKGCIHAFTDYLSQKPLYVREDEIVAVCSEPGPLAMLGDMPDPDEVYFSAVQKWGYAPGTRTPWESITRLKPSEHHIVYKVGDVSNSATGWSALMPRQDQFDVEELKKVIVEAVRLRVESSDVPVGCLVSGGLDSAIVYTLAKRYGDVLPFHIENGETEAALRVCSGVTVIKPREVNSDKILDYMQEPVDLGSVGPQIALAEALAGKCRVCLTGDGADEFFGGYSRASRYDSQASDVFHELVSYHLPRLDRVMSRNKIEQRSPFLARDVATAALELPRNLRIDKKILRDLFRDDLPKGVADTPKRPLRTKAIEEDREKNSVELVGAFRKKWWP